MALARIFSLGKIGCKTGTTCGCSSGCNLTIFTIWCGCVAPGTITVTVQKNNSSGAVVCSGTANPVTGNFTCNITATGVYYISASTTVAGYSNASVTVTITSVVGPGCVPSGVFSLVYPTQLTATTPLGSVTLVPSGTYDCMPGSLLYTGSNQLYVGTITETFGGGCTCPAASANFPFIVSFNPCSTPGDPGPPPELDGDFVITGFPSGQTCPGIVSIPPAPHGSTTGCNHAVQFGAPLTGQLCYPMNLSGFWNVPAMSGLGFNNVFATLLGNCSGTHTTVPVTVTQ